ncbi:MAG: hypothetical protein MR227_05775 [Firmicutes bacterium]|nr:hypothetical protein [Bacillota bacterium]
MNNLFFLELKKEKLFLIITLLLIISIFSFIYFYKYEEFVNYYGEYNNDNILVMIEKKDIYSISNKVYINNTLKKCEIKKISKDYIISNNYKMYYEVYYKCELNSSDIIDSYIFNIKISKGNITLFKKIFRKE